MADLPSLRSLGLLELHHLTSHDERVQGELIHLAVKSLLNQVLNNILKVKSVGGDNGGVDGVQS